LLKYQFRRETNTPQVEFVVSDYSVVSFITRSGFPETTIKTCGETNTPQVKFVVSDYSVVSFITRSGFPETTIKTCGETNTPQVVVN
jgi:hypothetical protein